MNQTVPKVDEIGQPHSLLACDQETAFFFSSRVFVKLLWCLPNHRLPCCKPAVQTTGWCYKLVLLEQTSQYKSKIS
jgi:hypothetical protein